jgi:hypothetical protein
MRLRSSFYVVPFALALGCAAFPTGGDDRGHVADAPLTLSVTADCARTNECTLSVTLRNDSGEPIGLYEDLLPWRRYGMSVSMMDVDTGEHLKEVRHIEDPDAEVIQLRPGQAISGTINLTDRFPELVATRKKSDLACFWIYKPRGELRHAIQPIVGALVLRSVSD